MTVTQQSARAAINWTQFSIGKDNAVQFIQPNSSAIALNRVVGNEGSVLNGTLSANGQVYLLNPNGILIGKDGRIDTAGLVASTLSMSDADFMAGKTTFSGNGSRGSVINLGTITARDGGYAALLGAEVRNQGTITATLGTALMSAGDRITLNFNGDSLVNAVIDKGVLNALVENGNAVRADGGTVVLTAKGLDTVLGAVVNNTGEIRAQSIDTRNGRILLLAQDGTTNVGGTLRAEGGARDGGFIETSGKQVNVAQGAVVSTKSQAGRDGQWLIDPTDFEISGGSGAQTGSGIGATTLATALGAGNVTIQTQASGSDNGDINVNAPVSWSANKLTLEAAGDINVNARMAATGTSSLDLKTGYNFDTQNPTFNRAKTVRMGLDYTNGGFTGAIDFDRTGTGILTINGDGYTLINSLGAAGSTTGTDLQGMNGALAGRFALAGNIDASATSAWNGGKGFAPIGLNTSTGSMGSFTGYFDGLGHTINGLSVYREFDGLGLFSKIGGTAMARNVGLTNVNIRASDPLNCNYGCGEIGALAGMVAGSDQTRLITINNAYSTGTIGGEYDTGGLVGNLRLGSMDYTYSNANVTSYSTFGSSIGGLVGYADGAGANYQTQTSAYVTRSWTSGSTITGGATVGGLIGSMLATTVQQSYSTSNVVGTLNNGASFGGLVGYVRAFSVISDAYARGAVSAPGAYSVGGLVGQIDLNGVRVFQNVYSTGAVTPVTAPGATKPNMTNKISGGLVATWWATLPVTTAFWDTTNSLSYSGVGTGKTASDMKTTSTYTNASWNFTPVTGVWRRRDDVNDGYPVLRAFGGKDQLSVYVGNPVTMTYGDSSVPTISAQSITESGCGINGGCISSLALGSMFNATTAAGSYGFNSAGVLAPTFVDAKYAKYFDVTYYSGSAGAPQSGSVVVQQRGVNISLNGGGTRAYDGTAAADASLFSLTGAVNGDQLSLSGSATLASKNAGTQAVSSLSGLTLNNANYTVFGNTPSGSVDITARTLTIASLTGANKTYDGTTSASFTTVDDHVSGDDVHVSATSTFADKNAGTGKAITVGSLSLGGTDAGNYTLAGYTPSNVSADITARTLAPTFSGVTKTYDGTTAATLTSTDDRVAGDTLTVSGTGAFSDKNAGAGKSIAVTGITLGGADAGNYVLAGTTGSATGTIGTRTLTTTFTGQDRTYDGSLNVQVSASGDDRVAGDVLTITASGALANKNAGQGKDVLVSGVSLGGTDAGNYVASATPVHTTASVTPRTLTIASLTGANKTYDGTTSASFTTVDDHVSGDDVHVSATSTFADKNAGTGKAITVGGLSLGGTDAGNYTLAGYTPSNVSADITARTLAPTFSGVTKTYDGTTAATLTSTDDRVAGDTLAVSGTGAFSDKNAGAGKSIAVTGITLGGADAGNYVLAGTTGSATGTIGTRTLTTAFTGLDRVYDGGLGVQVSASGDNRVAGDVLTITASGAFANKNVGQGKDVLVSGISLGGADAGNYAVSATPVHTTASVTPRTLTYTISAANRVYDGSAAASVALATDNRLAGDQLGIAGTAAFADKNAGTGKTVTASGLALTGADANNYVLSSPNSTATATIAKRDLTATFTVAGKVYDGTTNATVSIGDNRVSGDNLALTASGSYADKNAGAGKTVSIANVTLAGSDSGNYNLLTSSGSASAAITPRALDVGFAGIDRIYDGSLAVGVTSTDNRIAGDQLTVAGTARLADKNAGQGKDVTVSGIALAGQDAGNYVLGAGTAHTTVSVTPRGLGFSLAAADKVYDGTTSISVQSAGDNRVQGDALAISATGLLADKNVGQGKTVTVGNVTVAGSDAANYTFDNHPVALTASVTARPLAVSVGAAPKQFDGATSVALSVTGDNRISGDQLTLAATGTLQDTGVGTGKPVILAPIAITGSDSGNYRVVAPANVVADVQKRSVSYTLTPLAGAELNGNGKELATAATMDQLVASAFKNLVAGTPAGTLTYTIWKGGSQVNAIKDAGTYVVKAQFASADPSYVIDDNASQAVSFTVKVAQLPEPAATVAAQAATVQASSMPVVTQVLPAASLPAAATFAGTGNVVELAPVVAQTFGTGHSLTVLSAPVQDETTAGVTLDEARRMLGSQGGDNATRDVRVPVSRNSLAEIVNGGVKLPEGVNQLLYVVSGK